MIINVYRSDCILIICIIAGLVQIVIPVSVSFIMQKALLILSQLQSKSFYNVPDSRCASHFVERKGVQDKLDTLFNQHQSAEKTTVISLIGMGGAGKTQVALEYCWHRKKSNDFQGIFWLDASSPKRVGDDMMNIAKWLEPARELENTEAAVDLVKSVLSGWTKPWLMVFDNLDNPSHFKDIQGFFPSLHLDPS